MQIHHPSNETGWMMRKTSKKRSHKQGTGNERARTRADQEVTTSNGESAKQLMIREMRESSCEINFSCSVTSS